MSRHLVIAIAAAFVAGALAGCSPSGSDAKQPTGPITIAPDEHTLGSAKAPVTLIEYAAPSCPVCAMFDARVFPQLKSTYIDTGKVYYVFRVFPLRPADGAAEAMARCLPKESYMEFISLLFRRQSEWDPEFGVADAHAGLLTVGRVAGLTAEKADKCMEDAAVQKRINEIAAEGQARFRIEATPTIIINGEAQTPGAIPWTELQTIIEAALKKAGAPASAPTTAPTTVPATAPEPAPASAPATTPEPAPTPAPAETPAPH